MATTYNNLYLDIRQQLRKAGIEEATLEARELVCFGTNKSREELARDGGLYAPPELERRVRDLVERHLAGEPVAYLIGEWEFYGLPLDISRDVLIPRPDTEVLAEQAIGYIKTLGECRVLDLCAGSGCIGLAVAAQVPQARVVLGEWSDGALKICRQNVRRNSLTARVVPMQADAREKPEKSLGEFQCIVSNPPYIPRADIETLDTSVKDYEPHLALDGGEDGLDFYRSISEKWKAALAPGGRLYFDYTGPARYRGTVDANLDYAASGVYPLDKVSFQPKAEFSGTVVIPYMGTDSTGATYQGVVQITVTPPASAPRFSDMGNYGWAAPGVEFLAHYGITTGTGTGATFSPADQLTRCDYLLMLVRTFGFTAAGTDNFSDVPAGSYYASALATAKALGIAQAEAGNTFRPTAPVTREDAMVFLYRAMQKANRTVPNAYDSYLTRFPDGASVATDARPAMAAMAQAGVIKGDQVGRLNPQGTLTRAEMAVILHRGLTL